MMGEPVYIVPGEGRDQRTGNELPAGVERRVDGCAVVPRGSSEAGNFSSTVLEGLTLYMPGQPRLDADDRIRVRGDLYDVTGEPGVWRSPHSGLVRGTQVALDRAVG